MEGVSRTCGQVHCYRAFEAFRESRRTGSAYPFFGPLWHSVYHSLRIWGHWIMNLLLTSLPPRRILCDVANSSLM